MRPVPVPDRSARRLTHRAYRDGTRTLSGVTAFTKSWTPAVVLSHALWTRAFAADPTVVQKTITLNGLDVAVVGVAPEGFVGTELTQAAFFAPVSLQPAFYPERNFLDDPQVSWLTLLARRYDGTSLDQVRAELAVVANRIDRQQPGRATTLLVAPATSLSLPVARRDFASVAAIVVAAFGLILLIASANVANVLLARGEARSREIAMRLAVALVRAGYAPADTRCASESDRVVVWPGDHDGHSDGVRGGAGLQGIEAGTAQRHEAGEPSGKGPSSGVASRRTHQHSGGGLHGAADFCGPVAARVAPGVRCRPWFRVPKRRSGVGRPTRSTIQQCAPYRR
jgi:MacB-like periplasmic core domain